MGKLFEKSYPFQTFGYSTLIITAMKKIFSLCVLAFAMFSCNTPAPKPTVESKTKAEFKVSPATFTAEGGKGTIEGILQEMTPEGKVFQEKPLAKSDYTLSLKSGDASQITLDNENSTFIVSPGASSTFEIEAKVVNGVATGQSQVLTIVRGGKISYTFSSEPDTFSSAGGKGKIIGICKVMDEKGNLLNEKKLDVNDFTFSLKTETKEVIIHNTTKEFDVLKGNAATFELEASCAGSDPQTITIKRVGKLVYVFSADPTSFIPNGGKGRVTGICQATDAEGNVVEAYNLKKNEFMLSLKSGNASEIRINNAHKVFEVLKGDEEAHFVLEASANADGTSQELPIHREARKTPQPLLNNPLEYVAEYNINVEGTDFATSQNVDDCGFFNFETAVKQFSKISIKGKKYYLPSKEEWLAIVPIKRTAAPDYVDFDNPNSFDNIEETVVLGGNIITSLNDYRAAGNLITYALRYKGTDMVSAWKYEYGEMNGVRILKITSRSVKNITPEVTINEVSKPAYWEQNTGNDVVRILPACGLENSGSINAKGAYGFYWTSTPLDSEYAWAMGFLSSGAIVYGGADGLTYRRLGFSIRLFCDEQ